MVNGPIHVEVPLSNLFGEESCAKADDACVSFAAELKEIFADGVIDQKDFDIYKPKCEYTACPGEHDRYDRLRKLYASLKRFASMDGESSTLSSLEAAVFNSWRAGSSQYLGGDPIVGRQVTNLGLLGEALVCGETTKCEIKADSDNLLIVVHPNFFGKNTGATDNIEREINTAKAAGVPVMTLLEPKRRFSEGFESPDGYIDDLDPNTFVSSNNGEHAIKFAGNEVVMTGGYFDRCFQRALLDLIRNYEGTQLIIRIPSDAVFSRRPDTHNPQLKMDLEGEGSSSIEERMDLFLDLLLRKENFDEEYLQQPLDNTQACVVDWKNFNEIDPAIYNEEAAPTEPAGDAVEVENVAETDQADNVEYIEPTGFDWGIEVRHKDKVLFSRNCSNEVPPKVIIVFE